MAGITWHYVLKFIITGMCSSSLTNALLTLVPPGDASVGKSSLLVRLTDQRFITNPDPTLGVEFGSKLIEIPEQGKIVKLQCWDTAGTESFRSITRSYYRGAAGCLLVYDVTSRTSFMNARVWLADVREHADPHLTCILVGNKVDLCENPDGSSPLPFPPSTPLRQRQVTTEEAAQWAEQEGLLFVEASAKSGHNVDRAFEDASRDILDKVQRGVFDDDRSPGVKLSKTANGSVPLDQGSTKAVCCS
ncbi:ras family-domain-containing protein [Lanmaoa asiatica]|nr:ras family-domain-containing protein [Lanmaoa asiatica]